MARLLSGKPKRKFSAKENRAYQKRQAKREQYKNHLKNLYNTPSKYKGIKLVCAWTERDGKEAFVIPCLDNKIIWVPLDCVRHVNDRVHVLKRHIDIDHCFEEAGYPVEHVLLKLEMDKAKKTRRA